MSERLSDIRATEPNPISQYGLSGFSINGQGTDPQGRPMQFFAVTLQRGQRGILLLAMYRPGAQQPHNAEMRGLLDSIRPVD